MWSVRLAFFHSLPNMVVRRSPVTRQLEKMDPDGFWPIFRRFYHRWNISSQHSFLFPKLESVINRWIKFCKLYTLQTFLKLHCLEGVQRWIDLLHTCTSQRRRSLTEICRCMLERANRISLISHPCLFCPLWGYRGCWRRWQTQL